MDTSGLCRTSPTAATPATTLERVPSAGQVAHRGSARLDRDLRSGDDCARVVHAARQVHWAGPAHDTAHVMRPARTRV